MTGYACHFEAAHLFFQALFLFAFGGAGCILLASLFFMARSERKKQALAQMYPEKPWLWKPCWADGVIKGSSTQRAMGKLIFALVWNGGCIAVRRMFFTAAKINKADSQVIGWVLIPFTIVGVVLLLWAIGALLVRRQYGRSVFQMTSMPGVIGGRLVGKILTSVKIVPDDGFCVRLSCVNCVHSGGENSSTHHKLVWQDEQLIAGDLRRHDAYHSTIPISFQIPFECLPTDDHDPNNSIYWKLEITEKTSGFDYSDEFRDIPVFKTADSDSQITGERRVVSENAVPNNPEQDLRDAGVRKFESPIDKSCRFVFPMARHPGTALGGTLGCLMCLGAPVFLWYQETGWIAMLFNAVFGLVGLVLFLVTLDLWFYRSTVEASRRGLTVQGGLLGFDSSHWIDISEIVRFDTVSHMSSETLMYFDLVAICRNGKKVTLGKRISGKRLAMAMIRQIEQAMGKEEVVMEAVADG